MIYVRPTSSAVHRKVLNERFDESSLACLNAWLPAGLAGLLPTMLSVHQLRITMQQRSIE